MSGHLRPAARFACPVHEVAWTGPYGSTCWLDGCDREGVQAHLLPAMIRLRASSWDGSR